MNYDPGYQIRDSKPGFVVWSGYHSPSRYPSCFIHKDIVGYGATREAAETILRLLELSVEVSK